MPDTYPVLKICFATGLSSKNIFCSAFKRHQGLTPMQYRNLEKMSNFDDLHRRTYVKRPESCIITTFRAPFSLSTGKKGSYDFLLPQSSRGQLSANLHLIYRCNLHAL